MAILGQQEVASVGGMNCDSCGKWIREGGMVLAHSDTETGEKLRGCRFECAVQLQAQLERKRENRKQQTEETKMEQTENAVAEAVAEPAAPAVVDTQTANGGALALLERLATNPNTNPDALRVVGDLREKEIARVSQVQLDAAMAKIKAHTAANPLVRTINVDDKYNYAPLDAVQGLVDPQCAEHGIYYTFSQDTLNDGALVKSTLTIRGFGAQIVGTRISPPYQGNKMMNAVQAAGAGTTYDLRYLLSAMFGIQISTDTDGIGARDKGNAAPPKKPARKPAAKKSAPPKEVNFPKARAAIKKWLALNAVDMPRNEKMRTDWAVATAQALSPEYAAGDKNDKDSALAVLEVFAVRDINGLLKALTEAAEFVGVIRQPGADENEEAA